MPQSHQLPSPPRSFLDKEFVLTTHLIPAAVPRTIPDVPLPVQPAWTPDKEQWKAAVSEMSDGMVAMRYKQWNGELILPPSRKQLWACLNRYVRKDNNGNGVTLFFAHANGFPKEIWEPALLRLLEAHRTSHATYAIDEIWAWEAVNHGDACLINANNLSGMYDWQDNSRDMLQFLLYYLPSTSSSSALPTHLPRLRESTAQRRKSYGIETRTLIGVGHSLGGCTITRAAVAEQRLFSSLILVDPIIRPYPVGPLIGGRTRAFLPGAIQRQHRWTSRDEARKKFLSSPFFAAWDSAVLEVYLECGLYDDPDGGVKLKMSGIHEALTFSETMTPFETWDLVDALDPQIELRWIVPGKNPPEDAGIREQLVWRRPTNSSNIIITSSDHLITQEKPAELAGEIHAFLERKYGKVRPRL
ncbi:hypothetical protein WOLCODRAFT_130894 [Wolfiporia cocos MD-104 SS10]|uniref:AB hydrolase-1 domain-containing protein n=1 Tax=Wolfiporia cocos (strain MD-104) TaxID=742152 RepID=A0A2H3JL30_WOLCO|nr:hypothetical protein WOLCODRAFT_130894 [Wolfiporia cocos MD-104 SS10]